MSEMLVEIRLEVRDVTRDKVRGVSRDKVRDVMTEVKVCTFTCESRTFCFDLGSIVGWINLDPEGTLRYFLKRKTNKMVSIEQQPCG